MALLSGPRVPPAKGAATALVVLLHGYGADGNDLIGLAPHWQRLIARRGFRRAQRARPGARCPSMTAGFQWFPISRIDPHEMQRAAWTLAAPVCWTNSWMRSWRGWGLPPERLVLAGFQPGHHAVAASGPAAQPPAAIVGFSGLLADPPPAEGPEVRLFFSPMASADQVIPAGRDVRRGNDPGRLAGFAVQWHLAPGMGHGIDEKGLALAGHFLALALAGRLGTQGPLCCPL